ncbi:hypothetical protein C8R45DRAFT_1124211 [Mycena sanguinolenta]|nr:hypothetical protein C8R45DRAFT_1124211 [Mycena sanguinolenta]
MNHPYTGAASYIYASEHPGTPPHQRRMSLNANMPNSAAAASTSASRRSQYSGWSSEGTYTHSQRPLRPNRHSAALPPRRAPSYYAPAPAPAPRTPLPPNPIPQHVVGASRWFETPSPEAPPALPLPDPQPRESHYSTRRSTWSTRRSSSLLAHSHVASPSPPPSFTTATSPPRCVPAPFVYNGSVTHADPAATATIALDISLGAYAAATADGHDDDAIRIRSPWPYHYWQESWENVMWTASAEFKLSRFLELPFSLRRVAQLATDASSPVEKVSDALYQLSGSCLKYSDPEAHARKLLPVVYANLDPARLPDDTTAQPEFFHRILCATRSIALFSDGRTFDVTVACELWPRIWVWIQFIDNHDYFPDQSIRGYSRPALLNHLRSLMADPNVRRLVLTTAGVCVFVAHAWMDLVASGRLHPDGLVVIYHTVSFCDSDSSVQCLEECVEGAGGIDDFADLIVSYMKLLVCHLDLSKDVESRVLLQMLHGVLLFACTPRSAACTLTLQAGLERAGFFAVLADISEKLAGGSARIELVEPMMHLCIQMFICIFCLISPALEEALRAGVLRAVVVCIASRYNTGRISIALKHLVGGRLVGATWYYAFMRGLAPALPAALAIQPAAAFMHSPKWEEWKSFTALAQERLEYFREFQAKFSSTRSCANFEVSLPYQIRSQN